MMKMEEDNMIRIFANQVKSERDEKKMNVMKEIINVVAEKNNIHIQHYIHILKQNMMVRHQKVLMLIKSRMEKGEVDPVKIF